MNYPDFLNLIENIGKSFIEFAQEERVKNQNEENTQHIIKQFTPFFEVFDGIKMESFVIQNKKLYEELQELKKGFDTLSSTNELVDKRIDEIFKSSGFRESKE